MMSFKIPSPGLGVALGVAAAILCATPVQAQQVYVGVADQRDDLLKRPEQWQFVRENADGFYVSFIEMNWLKNNPRKFDPAKLAQTAALFTSKNAILESDHKDASEEDDRRYLDQLHAAGFRVPITSLNYGWSAARANNLKTYALLPGQAARLNLVQAGPWVIGGDITLPNEKNAGIRAAIDQSDGTSTDGPMGLWLEDRGKVREGSFSLVKYAHARGQKALVMLCPYGAGNKFYTPAQALSLAQQCVREHEDAGAIPDIWAVFEYATQISAVPEQIDGAPISSTTGMAYWLIHHLKDPDGAARLTVAPQDGLKTSVRSPTAVEARESERVKEVGMAEINFPTTLNVPQTVTYELRNSNPWLDLCPVLSARLNDASQNWDVRCTLNGVDVTDAIFKADGVACVGDFRLWHRSNPPQAPHLLKVTVTAKKPVAAQIAAQPIKPLEISLALSPHPSYRQQIEQRLVLRITPTGQPGP